MDRPSPIVIHAVIAAAGVGARVASKVPKQYLLLANGNSILEQSVAAIAPFCQQIVVAHQRHDQAINRQQLPLGTQLVVGGNSRAASVLNALTHLMNQGYDNDWVVVHDAARPFVSSADLTALVDTIKRTRQAAILAIPIADTVKQLGTTNNIEQTIDRSKLWRAQTPQAFQLRQLYDAYNRVEDLSQIGDEASVMEQCGYPVQVVMGSASNTKITYLDDLAMPNKPLNSTDSTAKPQFRIGSGFDVHAFTKGEQIILGGVKIEHSQAIAAHSDGDVVLHALCDAMLGALALGDIGQHFPDTDSKWYNANSRDLLKAVNQLVIASGFVTNNIDITIVAQSPQLAPYHRQMAQNIASDLSIDDNLVSIKATTTELLGFVGRSEGIAVQAQVLLVCYNF